MENRNDLNNYVDLSSNEQLDSSLRPQKLEDYIGQKEAKEMLNIYINTSLSREESLDHVLLYGPPGLGKTTLAFIIANEMNVGIKTTTGPALTKPGDLASILANLEAGDILFIDEIHRMPKLLEEMLYSAMEDFVIDIIVTKDYKTETLRVNLPPFTLVGATTRFGDLSHPLRDRFGIILPLHYYNSEELELIANRTSKLLNYPISAGASHKLSIRSRGTPRILNRLFRRIRDFAQYNNITIINDKITDFALSKMSIDSLGLDITDRKYLEAIIKIFKGGPVGLDNIARTIGEEVVTLEDVFEPYLLQEGFIIRTPRGRMATEKAYSHLKLNKK